MNNILNTIADQAAHFIPASPTEYLALQVARKLYDLGAFRQYLVLFEHYPEDLLLRIFRRCSESETLSGEHYMRTFRELTLQS
ncbi:MAG TPA: hypothetical protein VFR24_17360 [Candidatus Angelobacter sp.]|nr:hypothetical protein [Candidatus Angelobacter sp.]